MSVQAPFCQLSDVKAWLPVKAGVTVYDAKLLALTYVASKQIETHCRRDFDYQTVTEAFDTKLTARRDPDFGNNNVPGWGIMYTGRPQKLYLHRVPIDMTQPVVVKFDPMYVFGPDTVCSSTPGWGTQDYMVEAGRDNLDPKIIFLRGTGAYQRSVQVTYSGGFQVDVTGTYTMVAKEVAMACALQVCYLWAKNNPDNIGIKQDRTMGGPGNRGFKAGTADFEHVSGLCNEAAILIKDYVAIAKGRS